MDRIAAQKQQLLSIIVTFPAKNLLKTSGSVFGFQLLLDQVQQVSQIQQEALEYSGSLKEQFWQLVFVLWKQGLGFYIVNFVKQVCGDVHCSWPNAEFSNGETVLHWCVEAEKILNQQIKDFQNSDYINNNLLNLWFQNSNQLRRIVQSLIQIGIRPDEIFELEQKIKQYELILQLLNWVKKQDVNLQFMHTSVQEWSNQLKSRFEIAEKGGFETLLGDLLRGFQQNKQNIRYPTTDVKKFIFDVFNSKNLQCRENLCKTLSEQQILDIQWVLLVYYIIDAFQEGEELVEKLRQEFNLSNEVVQIGKNCYLLDSYLDQNGNQKIQQIYCSMINLKQENINISNSNNNIQIFGKDTSNVTQVRPVPVVIRFSQYLANLKYSQSALDLLRTGMRQIDIQQILKQEYNNGQQQNSEYFYQNIIIGIQIFLAAQQPQEILKFIRYFEQVYICAEKFSEQELFQKDDEMEISIQNLEKNEKNSGSEYMVQIFQLLVGSCLKERKILKEVIQLDFNRIEEKYFLNQLFVQGRNFKRAHEFFVLYFLKRQRVKEAVKWYNDLFQDVYENEDESALVLKQVMQGLSRNYVG